MQSIALKENYHSVIIRWRIYRKTNEKEILAG